MKNSSCITYRIYHRLMSSTLNPEFIHSPSALQKVKAFSLKSKRKMLLLYLQKELGIKELFLKKENPEPIPHSNSKT